jgi:hypothetical protein
MQKSQTPNPAHLFRAPLSIFWVGLLVRVLYITLAHTYRIRLSQDHLQFGWEMGRIARALVTGFGYADPFTGHTGPTAWVPPLYPLLIAGIFKVFGVYTAKSAWVILTINSVFSAATALLVYEVAARCFHATAKGARVAFWSGWLWALHPAIIQYAVHWVWDMALTAYFFSWILVLTLRLRAIGDPSDTHPQTTRRWLLFGLLWGLLALCNSTPLLFLPACGLWVLIRAWKTPAFLPSMGKAALSVVVFCCCLSPWMIRNYQVFHALIPMRGNLGAELHQSILEQNDGFPWGATIPVADHDPTYLKYKSMGEYAYVQQEDALAKQAISHHKRRFFRFALKRVYFFWVSVPHPFEHGVKGVFIEMAREINFCFLSLSGLLGLALTLKNRIPAAGLFLWAFLLIPLTYYFITVQARFRHPLEPLIIIFTCYLFLSATPRRTRVPASEI